MNSKINKKIAVIGAGPMGLMATYELLKRGYKVSLYERDDRVGGMSASFDLGGTKIERFYHFICATDHSLFNLLKELNLYDKLRWRETKMGFYFDGKLYQWGDPFSLLKFPKLNLISKIRYGTHVFYTKTIKSWKKLDKIHAHDWLHQWLGKKGYQVLWDSLFRLKFYEYQHDLSAAWIGTRIQRVAKSRKSIFKEELGYLEGGSDTLLNSMEKKIKALGGKIHLKSGIDNVLSENNQVKGVKIKGEFEPFDVVISTVPTPFIPPMVPDLPFKTRHQIETIKNIGVVCVVLKLKHSFSNYFWMNINDKEIEIPGIIEYTNLNPANEKVVYLPYYMPQGHHKYSWNDEQFLQEAFAYLKKINPNFNESWVLAKYVSRYQFAQTVCTTNFFDRLPPMKSELNGFYMADTAFYYPEDRSISESVLVGKKLAELMNNNKREV